MPTLDHGQPEVDRRAPPVARRSALGCTKVRDSCHACATSKIKCPREKPSCSKCKARGVECQYFFARRPGRQREDGSGHQTSCTSSNTSNTSTSTSSSNAPSSSSSSSSSTSSLSSPSNPEYIPEKDTHNSLSLPSDKVEVVGLSSQHEYRYATNGDPSPTHLPASDGFLDTSEGLMIEAAVTTDNILSQHTSHLSSVLADSNMFQSLSDVDSHSNDLDFSMTDYFEHPSIESNGVSCNLDDIGLLVIPETISFGQDVLDSNDLLSASFAVSAWGPSPSSSVSTSSTTNPNMTMAMMRTPTTGTSCGCVAEALDLLKTLSSGQAYPAFPIFGVGSSLPSSMTAMGSAQALLEENKQHIESLSSMLSCSACTEDTFRLVIVSMIVLKILERYASAARIQGFDPKVGSVEIGPRSSTSIIPTSKDQMSVLSLTYTKPWDDSATGFAPARLVLSELHRVQRLVNQLSSKLRGKKERDTRGVEQSIWDRPEVMNTNDKTQSTFSSNTLTQVESDIRNTLSSLSADIIFRLQQNE